jgi:predicted nucleic acid-binding protein
LKNTSLANPSIDFEDTIQARCATEWNADVIVTRDKTGFADAETPVLSPREFLERPAF